MVEPYGVHPGGRYPGCHRRFLFSDEIGPFQGQSGLRPSMVSDPRCAQVVTGCRSLSIAQRGPLQDPHPSPTVPSHH